MEEESAIGRHIESLRGIFQRYLDKTAPHAGLRWGAWGVLALAYIARVWVLHGFYIVTYVLGIYNLNLVVGFVTPKFLPSPPSDNPADGPSLPTRSTDEFRPFIRKLPEFKFWLSSSQAFLIGITCTFFKVFDIPVFWPVLLIYMIILIALTAQRQINHMRRYRYVPFDVGKPKVDPKRTKGTK